MDEGQKRDLDRHITRSDDDVGNSVAMAIDLITRRWAHQVADVRLTGQFLVDPTLEEVNEVRAEYDLAPLNFDDL